MTSSELKLARTKIRQQILELRGDILKLKYQLEDLDVSIAAAKKAEKNVKAI